MTTDGRRNVRTVRDGLNLCGSTDWFVRLEAALRVDEMRSENGVDEGGFSETRLA